MPDWVQQILVAVIVLAAVVMLARKTARSLFGKATAGHGGCGGGCEDCPSISAPEPSRLIQLEIQPPRNQTVV